ncbi:hypothetical protein [Methylobacterium sp. J-068]|uniref:hypothetical protein n=1 Tax=Methylobacterium sp. J-068 TaxID=2836649 RepID=UPI001FBB031D|nr:hypothetical protein [Methylobacterium sp. J-068]MCJ2036802.1 hypothetical protein [Methylobacterium sp. J-068]
MLDHIFTYSGEICSLAAFGMWLWLAMRAFPGLDVLVARHEDDMGLGAAASKPAAAHHFGKLSRLAVSLTAIAVICTAVGYAIPD